MTAPEPDVIVCRPWTGPRDTGFPGSVRARCDKCDRAIWLSRSGLRYISTHATVLQCIICAAQNPDVTSLDVMDETVAAARAKLGRPVSLDELRLAGNRLLAAIRARLE